MMHKRSRTSLVLSACGVLAVGLAGGTWAATSAKAATSAATNPAHTPTWHTVLSLANTNAIDTVVATGQTSGWAFPLDSSVAYERTGNTAWKRVGMPEKGGSVNVAEATSPSDVWAAYHTATGTHLDRWNGTKWTTLKSFPGQVTALTVLGPNDVWAFGGLINSTSRLPQGVFHFNGHGWTEVTSAFQSGYAVSDRSVWAVTGTTIEHFNGSRWSAASVAGLFPAPTPAETTKPELTGIVALAANDVYATGNGPLGAHIANGVILHYNGHAWSRAARAGFISAVGQQFASDDRGGLWLSAENVEGPSLLFHYSAGKVTQVTLPSSSGSLTGSNSVSRIPGTAQALSGGAIFNASNAAADRAVVFELS